MKTETRQQCFKQLSLGACLCEILYSEQLDHSNLQSKLGLIFINSNLNSFQMNRELHKSVMVLHKQLMSSEERQGPDCDQNRTLVQVKQ